MAVLPMSTVTEEGIVEIKTRACDMLLAQRVDVKMKGKKMPEVLNRLHLAVPTPRDNVERPPFIPPGARIKSSSTLSTVEMDIGDDDDDTSRPPQQRKKLERDIELEMGEDYFLDLKKNYRINESERYDDIPEIMEGKNIADFIDLDIMKRLEELEREEEMREAAGVYNSEPEDEVTLETRKVAIAIRRKKAFLRKQSWDKKTRNYPVMPRGPARESRPRKRTRSEAMDIDRENEDSDMEEGDVWACVCVCVCVCVHLCMCVISIVSVTEHELTNCSGISLAMAARKKRRSKSRGQSVAGSVAFPSSEPRSR